MHLENYIYAKIVITVRTIMVSDDNCFYKRILKIRAFPFISNIKAGMEHNYD